MGLGGVGYGGWTVVRHASLLRGGRFHTTLTRTAGTARAMVDQVASGRPYVPEADPVRPRGLVFQDDEYATSWASTPAPAVAPRRFRRGSFLEARLSHLSAHGL